MSNFFRSNSKSSASTSSSHPPSLKEEINFSNLSQSLDNWKIPKHSSKEIYKENKWSFSTDYSVKTVYIYNNNQPISDAVFTLIFTIAKTFIGLVSEPEGEVG